MLCTSADLHGAFFSYIRTRMGRLAAATKREVEALSRGDPEWWPGVLARIADGGALAEVVRDSAWSWGALWAWIQADETRSAQYDAALKARAQMMAFETVEIADGVAEDKAAVAKAALRVGVRKWVTSNWDRGRYGDATEVKHSGAIGMNLMAVLASLPRASAGDSPHGAERVVEAVKPEALEAYETVDEI